MFRTAAAGKKIGMRMNQIRRGRSVPGMKHAKVTVPWSEGLHLRRAAQLVKVAQRFRSSLRLKCDDQIADLRSIVSVLALCATMGTTLDLEAVGDDEQDAAHSVERVFDSLSARDAE